MTDTQDPSWSDIADWYDDRLVAGSGPHETAVRCLETLLPTVKDQLVLDVACGQGIASRRLAELGAEIIAVDLSEAMIENARRHGSSGQAIDFRVDDAQTLATVGDKSVDGAVCQLGLMDLPDLAAAIAAIRRTLRPKGWLIFVIGHPAFLTPDATQIVLSDGREAAVVTDYFEERFWRSSDPNGVRRAGNYHRTISTYLNELANAGFVLEQVDEPLANAQLAAERPLYGRVPIFFAARVRLA